MNRRLKTFPARFCVMAMFLGGFLVATPAGADPAAEANALTGFDEVRIEPGADPAGYRRVLLEPVQVEFHPQWDPRRTGSRLRLGERERERIRSDVAGAFDRSFRHVLEASPRLEVVDEPGPGVLRFSPRLVDLTVNVIDDRPAVHSHTLVRDGDRFTLAAELSDAGTGAAVGSLRDERSMRGFQDVLRFANRLTTVGEAEMVFRAWAKELRDWLESGN